jgi:Zn-dependent protease
MKIGRLGGIDLHIHWSFWLLVLFYLMSATAAGGLAVGLYQAVFVISVFACIVAHEYGHAFAAARYGIPTSDITVLAFGGIARLTRMPSKPMQEFVIAIAGPLVNVAIAALLGSFMLVGLLPTNLLGDGMTFTFFDLLLSANLFLVLFNLLPAFPMDGGRVLRSLLAMRTGHLRATEIAARIGRWMALVFGIYGIFYSLPLVLIAGFVFFAGTAELMQARVRAAREAQASPLGGGPFAGAFSGAFPGGFQFQAGSWPQQYPYPFDGPLQDAGGPGSRDGGSGERSGPADVIDAVDVRRID